MKSHRNIFIAFILNLGFSLFELIGGIFTGSVAIISDSLHDFGDAAGIGISFLLEKKSTKQPDSNYTYGYARYSVIGSVFTTMILLFGSVAVIYNAVKRILEPTEINYNGMIILAVIGASVNIAAAYFTKDGDSLNQKAVNLHMLEDVLGWIVVLIGAVIMKFTDISVIDPLLSMGVAVFILVNAVKNLKESLELFLEKTPEGLCVEEIKESVEKIEGVEGVHHIHLWSMSGQTNYATMHIVTKTYDPTVKSRIKDELKHKHNISHATLEIETAEEMCSEKDCHTEHQPDSGHGHHHHHHAHHH